MTRSYPPRKSNNAQTQSIHHSRPASDLSDWAWPMPRSLALRPWRSARSLPPTILRSCSFNATWPTGCALTASYTPTRPRSRVPTRGGLPAGSRKNPVRIRQQPAPVAPFRAEKPGRAEFTFFSSLGSPDHSAGQTPCPEIVANRDTNHPAGPGRKLCCLHCLHPFALRHAGETLGRST
jgi:hypothetical protein